MTRTACEICGRTEFGPLFGLDRRQIVRCRGCGYTFAAVYDETALAAYYRTDYYTSADDPRIREWISLNMPVWRGVARDILRLCPRPPCTLLDIGAGSGGFLLAMHEALPTLRIAAVESCPEARQHLRRQFSDISFPAEDVEEIARVAGKFDCITMLQCLEHVAEPGRLCRELKGLLAPGGLLLLTVPNRRSHEVLFGRAVASLCYREHTHLQFFAAGDVRRLLGAAGFTEVRRLAGFGGAQHRGIRAVLQYLLRQAGISTELRFAARLGREPEADSASGQ